MRSVDLDPAAVNEIRDAAAWYSERRPGLDHAFLDEVEACLAYLTERPGSYPALAEPAALTVRRALLPGFPFAVVFLQRAEKDRVIAVAHVKRQPGYWLHRLREVSE